MVTEPFPLSSYIHSVCWIHFPLDFSFLGMLLCYPKSPLPLGSFGPFRYQWMLRMVPNIAQTLQYCKMLLLYPEGDLCQKVTLLSISGKILFICNLFWCSDGCSDGCRTTLHNYPRILMTNQSLPGVLWQKICFWQFLKCHSTCLF